MRIYYGYIDNFSRLLQAAIVSFNGSSTLLSEVTTNSHDEHDIDFIINSVANMNKLNIFQNLENDHGWKVCQEIQYDIADSYYYVAFKQLEDDSIQTVKFDLLYDPHGTAKYLVQTDEVINSIQDRSSIPTVPSNDALLTYVLAKKLLKGYADSDQLARIATLTEPDTNYCNAVLKYRIDATDWTTLIRLAKKKKLDEFNTQLRRLKWKYYIRRFQCRRLIHLIPQLIRFIDRIQRPVGLTVELSNAEDVVACSNSADAYIVLNNAFRSRIIVADKPINKYYRRILEVRGYLILLKNDESQPVRTSEILQQMSERVRERMQSC